MTTIIHSVYKSFYHYLTYKSKSFTWGHWYDIFQKHTFWHSLKSQNCYSTNYMGFFFDLYLVSPIAVAPQKVQWDWECQCLIGLVPIWNSPSAKYKKLLLAELTVIPTHFFFQMMSAQWGKITFSIKNKISEEICT